MVLTVLVMNDSEQKVQVVLVIELLPFAPPTPCTRTVPHPILLVLFPFRTALRWAKGSPTRFLLCFIRSVVILNILKRTSVSFKHGMVHFVAFTALVVASILVLCHASDRPVHDAMG